MQPAQRDVAPAGAIVVGDSVSAVRIGDVDLDDHEIGPVVELQPLHVIVNQFDIPIGGQKPGQGGKAKRRKQRILDRAP